MLSASIIASIVALATPGHQCAAISNVSNAVAFTSPTGVKVARYSDMGGPALQYRVPVPPAARAAEALLQIGDAGPKVRVACRKVVR